MVVSNDETFGPLAPLFKFSADAEVVEMANDTEFGLAGYFFSRDFNRIWRIASALEVGMVGVNTGKISAPESPFGGVCSFPISMTDFRSKNLALDVKAVS